MATASQATRPVGSLRIFTPVFRRQPTARRGRRQGLRLTPTRRGATLVRAGKRREPRPRRTNMTYAQGRTFFDADSHIMELPDFLKAYADPGLRDRMPAIQVPRIG